MQWVMVRTCPVDAPHEHETNAQREERRRTLETFLSSQRPRQLTRAEYGRLVPAHGPTGCMENKRRSHIRRRLIQRGFTCP
jgi:hypothetical protein